MSAQDSDGHDQCQRGCCHGSEVFAAPAHADARPGRNDPCWCGSNNKYKKCCLLRDQAKN
ncbi:MAG: SEC-C metal-binding domain-containing protein [Myxococcota bacterium]